MDGLLQGCGWIFRSALVFGKSCRSRYVNKLKDNMSGSYLGPKYEENSVENDLKELGANYIKCQEEICKNVAKELNLGKIVGWFQVK